jgi:hypothetical protein
VISTGVDITANGPYRWGFPLNRSPTKACPELDPG